MKPTKILITLAILLAPGLALAQGYYGGGGPGYSNPPPPRDGFHQRAGRLTFGLGLGLGAMDDQGSKVTSCNNCNFNPLALNFHLHVGGMLSNRFALMGEYEGDFQTVHSDAYNGDTVLRQDTLMLEGQFWIIPILWIKGGIGFAHLQADDAYFTYDFGGGMALMIGAGVELLSARNFSVDLQGRLVRGNYNGLADSVTAGTIGIGVNWY